MRTQGTIISWLERGFGFIARDDMQGDIFIHRSALTPDRTELSIGTRVEFEIGEFNSKPCAESVTIVDQLKGGA